MVDPVHHTVDRLFRHESGKMIAVLSRMLGLRQVQTAQDITQETLLQALHTWSRKGIPEEPAAWLYRVAKNKAIDHLRREKRFAGIRSQHAILLQTTPDTTISSFFEENEIQDSQLRMMFACCHPSINPDSQIAFALKTLCGLSAAEIARAFMTEEETIAKRIYRAKQKIRTEGIDMELPSRSALPGRLDAVLHSLYLLFNEGYNSSHPEVLIRENLCEEAMRMAFLLTSHQFTDTPQTNALLALFCMQASRFPERVRPDGSIVLLAQQDRKKWYRPLIEKGFFFLEKATKDQSSSYHIEAAIAYMHVISPTYETTDWRAIYYLYEILVRSTANPVIRLNKAIAASFAIGPDAALVELERIPELSAYHLYHTAVGQVLFELGRKNEARQAFRIAITLTASLPEQCLLQQKIERCGES